MEDFVDFKVIKEKIIKTDSIINMFLDLKKKNAELKRTIQLRNKQYKQLTDDIAISNLENERKLHQYDEEKRQCEKLKTDNAQLKLDYSSIREEYNKNLNELQILQIKYQSTCRELVECQTSFDEYRNRKVSTELPVKVQRKRRKKKNNENLEMSEINESRNSNHFSANETGESEEEGKLLEMKLTEKSEDITQPFNFKLTKRLADIEEIDNKANHSMILDLNTEIEELSASSNVLKKEVNESNERNNVLIKEWEDVLKSKEAEWYQTEQKLRHEVAELKKRLEFYDRQNNSISNVEKSIFDCEEETKELAKCNSKQSMSDLWDQQPKQHLQQNLVDNGDDTEIEQLSSFPECVLSGGIADAEIECELPPVTEYDQSDNETVSDYINDIFGEMRVTALVSPIPESEEDQIPVKNNITRSKSPKSQLLCVNNSNTTEPKFNCHIPIEASNQSNIYNNSINDRYNKLRRLKAKRLGNLLNIKKAKNLYWLRKGKLFYKSNTVNADTATNKIDTYESDIGKSIKKNEQDEIHTKKTSMDDIITVLADLVSQKLKYPRPRKKSTRLNQIDNSRNVLEVNRMLLRKARQLVTTPNSCEKNQNSKEIMESDEHPDLSKSNHPNNSHVPPGEIASVEHLSKASSSERSSSEVELPIVDSCYESQISNPPSIENITDDKKNITDWTYRNRIESDGSHADGCQSNNISLNKETANLKIDEVESNKHGGNEEASSNILSTYSMSSENRENSIDDHNFEVKEGVHSHELSTYNVESEINNTNEILEKNSLHENCLHDHNFKAQNHERKDIQECIPFDEMSEKLNENIKQNVNTVEHVDPIMENLEIDNGNLILSIQKNLEVYEGNDNLSLNSSELEVNENDKTSENYNKLLKKNEDISDVFSNKEVDVKNKMIFIMSNDESIKNKNKITNSSDNIGYEEEKDGTIHNNMEMGCNHEKYKELFQNKSTYNKSANSPKLVPQSLNKVIDKKSSADNQKIDSLESLTQSYNVNETTVPMSCTENEGIDNSNELNQEYNIDNFHLLKNMNGQLPDNSQTENKNSERKPKNNHDRFQIIEKSIITHAELQNLKLEKEVVECQIEDFKQRGSVCSDELLELMKKETSDILQSDNNSKNENIVISSNKIENNYQFQMKNDTELVGTLNPPVLEMETEEVNNCYTLFSLEHDDNSLNSTEKAQSYDWEEPTNRSNESMWYEFSHNIFRDIRISKSYDGNVDYHEPAQGNFDFETNRSNEIIPFKHNSEEELSNIGKLSKLDDIDISFESTNESMMKLKNAPIKSEIKKNLFESEKNGEVFYDNSECSTQSSTNKCNENNVNISNDPVLNVKTNYGLNIVTKIANERNENNAITSNDVVQKFGSDKDFDLKIAGELNYCTDMEIDLDISQHLLEEIEEEFSEEDSSICVSSMINNLICESPEDVKINYLEEVETSSTLLHHLVKEKDTQLPECNENSSEKLNSNDKTLTYSEYCGNSTERAEVMIYNNKDNNGLKSGNTLTLLSENDEKSSNKRKKTRNSNKTTKTVICNYNLRKSSKLEENIVVPVAGKTLNKESLNTSNENNSQEDNKSGSVGLNTIKTESLQNFNIAMDLIGSFSESSDNECFSDETATNYKGFKLKQNRTSNKGKVLRKKKVPTKKGFLMKKSIRTYKDKNLACNLVEQQIIAQTKDTTMINGKSSKREDKLENTISHDIPINRFNSYLSEKSNTSKIESTCQDTKTHSDSLDEKKGNSVDEIIKPQSSLFKRTRTYSGNYSVTSVKRTSRNINTKTNKESKLKPSSSTCSVTDEISSVENKQNIEVNRSSNDFQEEIDGLGLGGSTIHDESEQNYELSAKKIRKSLLDVEKVNERTSPKKIVKKKLTPRKSKSSFYVDHNIKNGNIGDEEQSIINSSDTPPTVNNRALGNSCLKEEKINILQDVIFRPATTKPKKLEIKSTTQMRISGFKRPNNTKVLPPCPQSPPLPSCEETVSHVEPIIIPLEKPPKMESSKAAALFRKLITYSKEEKTVEEISRQFTSQDVDHISRLILEQITQDTEKANKDHTSAPLMTDTQRVMLGFMLKLEEMNVQNLITTYLKISEMRLLQASTLQEVDTITRLHVAICKSHKYIERMRRMCCDAFYFMGDLAIPFLFIVLVSWIEVLPMEEEMSGFPMVKVIIQLVNLKHCNFPGYNLLHLRDLLNKYYNYPIEPWNTNSFFQELFNNYLKNPVRPSDFAILLYCKNNTSEWVYEKINNLVRPTLANIRNDNFKATVIILIGNIISQFNGKVDSEYVDSAKQWFKSMIEEEGVAEVVKKSIILSLRKLPKTSKKSEINNIVNKR